MEMLIEIYKGVILEVIIIIMHPSGAYLVISG